VYLAVFMFELQVSQAILLKTGLVKLFTRQLRQRRPRRRGVHTLPKRNKNVEINVLMYFLLLVYYTF
jgi:hypothetical protein